MSVYPWVIVGTDGSVTATRAVRRAAVLAAALSARLLVATVFQRTRPEDIGPPSVRAQMPGEGWIGTEYQGASATAMEGAGLAARTAGVSADTTTPEGEPATGLLEVAEAHPGSLLVVGSHGMTGAARFLLGGVPDKVVHHAVGDVLVVRAGQESDRPPPQRLLVGTDGSTVAHRAVARAVQLGAALDGEITVLCAHDNAARARAVVEEAGRRAAAAGVVWHPAVVPGPAADALLDVGARHDLVVIGNRGLSAAGRFLLGSVAKKISHHTVTDLLIVKPTSSEDIPW